MRRSFGDSFVVRVRRLLSYVRVWSCWAWSIKLICHGLGGYFLARGNWAGLRLDVDLVSTFITVKASKELEGPGIDCLSVVFLALHWVMLEGTSICCAAFVGSTVSPGRRWALRRLLGSRPSPVIAKMVWLMVGQDFCPAPSATF